MLSTIRTFSGRVFAALLFGTMAYFLVDSAPAKEFEHFTQDWRIRTYSRPAKTKVVILKISADTQAAWSEPAAFWGPRIAKVLNRLADANVRAIGLDVKFEADIDAFLQKESPGAKSYVADLATAMTRVQDKLVLPKYLEDGGRRERTPLPAYREIAEMVGNLGSINLGVADEDADRVIRRGAIAYQGKDQASLSFGAILAMRACNWDPAEPSTLRNLLARSKQQGVEHPFYIQFQRDPFPSYPIESVENSDPDSQLFDDLYASVVLIGADFADDNDHWMTPFGSITGVEVHGNIVTTLLDGTGSEDWTMVSPAWIAVGFTVLLALTALVVPPIGAAGYVLLVAGGWTTIAFQKFENAHQMMPVGGPLFCALSAFAVAIGLRAFQEASSRRRVESVFGKHVSKEVRNYLMSAPENLVLGGSEVEGSVLFVDVWDSVKRGATRTPHVLIAELNELFDAIVPAVTGNQGLINRFTGDGFIALFGVPRADTGHAESAVRASLAIQATVEQLNALRPGDPFTVSCGVHSGRFVCGNLGSDARAEFTVIGDVVNTAARIESANRELHSRILISEETRQRLTSNYPIERHRVMLKGKGLTEVCALGGQTAYLGAENIAQREIEDLGIEVGREQ